MILLAKNYAKMFLQKSFFHHLLGPIIHSFAIIYKHLKTEAHKWGNKDPHSCTRCVHCYSASRVLMLVFLVGLRAAWLLPRRCPPGPPQSSDGSDGVDRV